MNMTGKVAPQPRSSRLTRRRIVETAYELFYNRGFNRVGVDAIAAKAGVTKRTLYYHFPSKDHLLAGVFHHYSHLALKRIEKWGSNLPHDPEGMIDALFASLARWAAKPRWEGAGFTRLVMELADLSGHPARSIARRHKREVEAWLEAELYKREVSRPTERAAQVMLLIEGCIALLLIHPGSAYPQQAANAAKQLLISPKPSKETKNGTRTAGLSERN
jgi:AcrR family transcriptional regulator